MMSIVNGLKESQAMARTQSRVQRTTIPIAEKIGVTFGTTCKYGRELIEINEQAVVQL